jgi:short-subunit dehydrogenase involved in D-alanine esterification of teichoic acids
MLHKLGNQIIISGRRKSHLDATTPGKPRNGLSSIAAVTKKLIAQFPSLNAPPGSNASITKLREINLLRAVAPGLFYAEQPRTFLSVVAQNPFC